MALDRVWVFLEVAGGKAAPAGLELLTKARELGSTVEAVVFSPEAEQAAGDAGAHGAATLYAASDPAYTEVLLGGPAADALAALVEEHKPDLILFAMTQDGRDVAGRLAAKLGVPVVANALEVAADGAVSVGSSVFGATLNVTTALEGGAPAIVIVRPKSFAAEPSGAGPAKVVPVA
ncbi:MAG: electron transfer flavoprotein subunit alpha/FixB family protein, partial [Candidatus Dormibacteraeota bacterium]|nr:electron transfer flavoprotein subunit alpha/FixB family protein [Candidatus Dormibacteraeota bacterium]